MKRTPRSVVVLAVVLAVTILQFAAVAAAQLPQFSPFSSDIQITAGGEQAPQQMDGKLYVGNGHMRMDMSAHGSESAVITDFATQTVTILMIEPKMYMVHKAGAISRPGMASNPTQDLMPFDPENPCAKQPDITCKKIGVETVSGRTCDHWQITDKNGRTFDVWVDEALRFPVKTVAKNGTVLLTNIKEGQPAASLFEIPPDFKKLDMGSMAGHGMSHPPQN